MNEQIIMDWNRQIKPEDNVIIMGDNGDGTFEQMKSVFSRLNGKLTATSKHLNEKFTKAEWKEIGFSHFWSVSMFNTLPDGSEIIYLIKPILKKTTYNSYALIIVDSENPIEGMTDDKCLSVDAAKWQYSPLNTDNLLEIYNNMKEFENMSEGQEHRSDIEEV